MIDKILADADAVIMADVYMKRNKEEGQGDVTGEMCSKNFQPHRGSEEGWVLACTMRYGTPSRIMIHCWPSALNENSSPPWAWV